MDLQFITKNILGGKDVEPFLLKSAYECIWFKWAWRQAHILTEI